jgi:hypothetical protein
MRVRHRVNVVVFEDKEGKNKLFAPDDALAEVILDGYTEVSSGTVVLPAAGPFTVPFASIAAVRGLYLRGNGDFTLALNGAPPFNVKRGSTGPAAAVGITAKVFLEAQVTSAVVVAGSAEMTLTYCAFGDPLA